jgi:hypothetical protein
LSRNEESKQVFGGKFYNAYIFNRKERKLRRQVINVHKPDSIIQMATTFI